MGAPLAARPLVIGSALGAVHATEARGNATRSVACHDVGGLVLTEQARQHARLAPIRGPQVRCSGQSPKDAIEMEAAARWRE